MVYQHWKKVLLLTLFFLASGAQAAQVIKVSGQKVLLKLNEAEILDKGDRLMVYDRNNRKTAILQVVQVKGTRAIAKKLKGKVAPRYTALVPSKAKKSQAEKKMPVAKTDTKSKWGKKLNFGVVGGFNSVTMDVDMSSEIVNNKGTNFLLKGYARYHWMNNFSLMATAGYVGFNSTGTSASGKCDGGSSTTCTTKINFLSSEFWGQAYLSRGKIAFWMGGGMSASFPLTKTSTTLNESEIGITNLILFGVGADFYLKNGKAVPFWFEIASMPPEKTVKASYIGLNIGYQF